MSFPIRLTSGFEKKKRRKKKVPVKKPMGFRIVDDDIDVPAILDEEIVRSRKQEVVEDRTKPMAQKRVRESLLVDMASKKQKIQHDLSIDDDESPPRRPRMDSDDEEDDQSPLRQRMDSDDDQSPPRARMDSDDEDQSPVRRRMDSDDEEDQSPVRRPQDNEDDDQSPPRNATKDFMKIEKREGAEKKKEKRKEDPEAAKRELEEWTKGSVQRQKDLERRMNYLEEIQKPFSRSRDDEELEKELKGQNRFGDPMAKYLSSSKVKKDQKPTYKGPLGTPNRFNIPPGFRWDGVDRSNHFESFWFKAQAERKATKDAAYKWSTEDM